MLSAPTIYNSTKKWNARNMKPYDSAGIFITQQITKKNSVENQ
jgi:hypothetical protein